MNVYNPKKGIQSISRNNNISQRANQQNTIFTLFYIYFNKYFKKDKEILDYPNVRFHYVDVRNLFTFEKYHLITNRYSETLSILDIEPIPFIKRMKEDIKILKEYIGRTDLLQHIENVESSISDSIIKFINNKYDTYKQEFDSSIGELDNIIDQCENNIDIIIKNKEMIEKFKDELYKCTDCLFMINCLIMDKYTLFRMFRTFGKSKTNVKGQQIYSGATQNVIFYGGAKHSQIYAEFMNSQNAEKGLEIHYNNTPVGNIELELQPPEKINCTNLDVSKSFFMKPIVSTDSHLNKSLNNMTGGKTKNKKAKKTAKKTAKKKNL
jgi:hypothetical protein